MTNLLVKRGKMNPDITNMPLEEWTGSVIQVLVSNVMGEATTDGTVLNVDRHVRRHAYEGMVCTDTPTAGSSLLRIML